MVSIIQTRDGAMWFGTGFVMTDQVAGISRMVLSAETGEPEWSSYRFEGFRSAHLLEAQDGTIWANLSGGDSTATNDRRTFLNGTWEIVDSPYRTQVPDRLAQTLDGSIWFPAMGGVVRYDGAEWAFVGRENGMEGSDESWNLVFADQDGTCG